MGLFKKVTSLFDGGERGEGRNIHREYVRCSRCGERIAVRVDLDSELTPQFEENSEGAYYVRKGGLGSGKGRCFQMIEVELYFNSDRQVVSRYASGGEFISQEEFESEEEEQQLP